ncbi:YfjI family protein [Roseospira navarrensis]|uniref:DUF3987 domain-containing protein n=1 Tax=Roseospira navarrensis TaxID=140058 RepID=A0A7X2D4R3_9PROT|nr:YfjI family protein [Roseospira navarrensis]MQX36877.1 DUF3987 domain-containing protein [Roseospira navarrensis]
MMEDFTPEPPRPLLRDLPEGDPYPVDALGPVLGGAARAIHEKIQAPLGMCAQSVLAAAALTVQGRRDVALPHGQARPLSCFFLSIAPSGERKSSCDSEALAPVRTYEQTLRAAYDEEEMTYRNEKEAWDACRQAILRGKKSGTIPDIRAKLDGLGPEPAPPLKPVIVCAEPTFEGLCRLYEEGRPSLGIFSAEGGQFIGGHGMSEENQLRTAAALSEVWDGQPITRVRGGTGTSVLPGRRLAMHMMTQPDVASRFLQNRVLGDQGLLSRFLVCAPAPAAGTRCFREPSDACRSALHTYERTIAGLLREPLPLAEGQRNELAPPVLGLSANARARLIPYIGEVEARLGPAGMYEAIRALANKLPEHAARLAAVLALVAYVHTDSVAANHMEAGIALADFYAGEAVRLHMAGHDDPDLRHAQRALDWLHTGWGKPVVMLANLYQSGPGSLRSAKDARRITRILEDHGWLVPIPGAEIDGARRKEAWRVVRG